MRLCVRFVTWTCENSRTQVSLQLIYRQMHCQIKMSASSECDEHNAQRTLIDPIHVSGTRMSVSLICSGWCAHYVGQ